MDPATDPFTLLCEDCGYNINSLPVQAHCPECGRAVQSSVPEARAGSPWQRGPGLWSLLATYAAVLRRPDTLFRSVRIDLFSGATLLAITLLLTATTIVAPWSGTLVGDPVRTARMTHRNEWLTAIVVIPLQVLAVAAVLLLLTLIEWAGIQFWARRRGARLTPLDAWQVCAHASVGWLLSAGGMWVGLVTIRLLVLAGVSPGSITTSRLADWLFAALPIAGIGAGLLAFEILVYIGVRHCRYANRPRRALVVVRSA